MEWVVFGISFDIMGNRTCQSIIGPFSSREEAFKHYKFESFFPRVGRIAIAHRKTTSFS